MQITDLIRELYPDYIKNFQNSIIRTNKPITKWVKELDSSSKKNMDGKQAHEKMYILSHQGNAN